MDFELCLNSPSSARMMGRRLGLLSLLALLSHASNMVTANSRSMARPWALGKTVDVEGFTLQLPASSLWVRSFWLRTRSVRAKRVALPKALRCSGGGGVDDDGGVLGRFVNVLRGARGHLVAAGTARAVSIFAMYPVDTIKTRLQMGQTVLTGSGLGGLYRGISGSMLGQVPYGTLVFGSYEVYKEQLAARLPQLNLFGRTTLAAILGDLTGSLLLCPSEVVKQQMQGGMYSHVGTAVAGIWGEGGGLAGFYRGYKAQIARDVPFRVVQLVAYEFTKKVYLKLRGLKSQVAERGGVERGWRPAAAAAAAASTILWRLGRGRW